MRRYLARQLVQLMVVIVGISMLAFAILHVSRDPVVLLLPQNAGKEEYARYHKLLGLDKPIYVQYWKFASRAIQGDFGKSWYTDTPAFRLVLQRMAPTIYLTLAGLVMALLIALPLGILAALKRHSFVDNLCTMVAVAGQAMPIFWLGIMLIIIFAVRITVLGLQFGHLLGGAIITETVFAWPGVATLAVESIRNQDFPVVQCAVVLLALIIVSVNFLVDMIVGLIDPRIRVGA